MIFQWDATTVTSILCFLVGMWFGVVLSHIVDYAKDAKALAAEAKEAALVAKEAALHATRLLEEEA